MGRSLTRSTGGADRAGRGCRPLASRGGSGLLRRWGGDLGADRGGGGVPGAPRSGLPRRLPDRQDPAERPDVRSRRDPVRLPDLRDALVPERGDGAGGRARRCPGEGAGSTLGRGDHGPPSRRVQDPHLGAGAALPGAGSGWRAEPPRSASAATPSGGRSTGSGRSGGRLRPDRGPGGPGLASPVPGPARSPRVRLTPLMSGFPRLHPGSV